MSRGWTEHQDNHTIWTVWIFKHCSIIAPRQGITENDNMNMNFPVWYRYIDYQDELFISENSNKKPILTFCLPFSLNVRPFLFLPFHLPFCSQQYHYQEDDSPPLDQGFPRLTNEVRAPELVHVSEKNLSEIENVHGYVSHSHISPLKVSTPTSLPSFISSVGFASGIETMTLQPSYQFSSMSDCQHGLHSVSLPPPFVFLA